MLVQPVSLSLANSGKNINIKTISNEPKNRIIQKNDEFQLSFKGYERLLEAVSSINYKQDSKVEEAFGVLFHELITEPMIVEKTGFSEILKIYKKNGFRGLMHELWKATPEPGIAKIIEKSEEEPMVLISKDEKPLFEMFSLGRQGFWNSIFNRKSAPRDTKLVFISPNEKFLMEFGLDKHGAVQISQKRNWETVYTTFHNTTGNRKIVARHPHGAGNPEIYYYKPDGSYDDFKNHIQGGPVINTW